MKYFQIVKFTSILFFLSVIVACSSSGGDDQSTGSGKVSLLITDGPTTDFDQINITLESVSFLKDDEPTDDEEQGVEESEAESLDDSDASSEVVLFEETRVINLLALQNYSNLLSTTTLPVGSYSKIRLRVSQVELVKLNSDGTVFSSDIAKLPANGKIDLNPKGSFDVAADSHMMIELDMDAKKSIHIVKTGSGKYIFRPVIFVNILGEDELKLVVLNGRVLASTGADANSGLNPVDSFKLCKVDVIDVNDSCLDILLSADTVVQNTLIEVISAGSLADNNVVTVLGKAGGSTINALHVVIEAEGASQNLALLAGEANSAVNIDSVFEMETDDENSAVLPGTILSAEIATGARVFNAVGGVVGNSAIVNGSDVDVFGLVIPDLTTASAVKAAFVIVDNEQEADDISGTITAINSADFSLTVTVESDIFSGDVCVDIDQADVFLLAATTTGITSNEASISELKTGMLVDIYGEDEGSSCLSAEVVLVTGI